MGLNTQWYYINNREMSRQSCPCQDPRLRQRAFLFNQERLIAEHCAVLMPSIFLCIFLAVLTPAARSCVSKAVRQEHTVCKCVVIDIATSPTGTEDVLDAMENIQPSQDHVTDEDPV